MNLGFSNSLLASSSHMLLHHIGIYLIRVTSLLLILLVSPLQFYNILNHLLIASSLLCIMTTHCGHSKIMNIHSLSPDWPSLCPVSPFYSTFQVNDKLCLRVMYLEEVFSLDCFMAQSSHFVAHDDPESYSV